MNPSQRVLELARLQRTGKTNPMPTIQVDASINDLEGGDDTVPLEATMQECVKVKGWFEKAFKVHCMEPIYKGSYVFWFMTVDEPDRVEAILEVLSLFSYFNAQEIGNGNG